MRPQCRVMITVIQTLLVVIAPFSDKLLSSKHNNPLPIMVLPNSTLCLFWATFVTRVIILKHVWSLTLLHKSLGWCHVLLTISGGSKVTPCSSQPSYLQSSSRFVLWPSGLCPGTSFHPESSSSDSSLRIHWRVFLPSQHDPLTSIQTHMHMHEFTRVLPKCSYFFHFCRGTSRTPG